MRNGRILLCLALGVLLALPVLAQGNPTARVSGQVVSADGQPLPGTTVTFASPNLQGTRVVVTDGNGNFASPPLAPGDYEINFALEGFQTQVQRVALRAASQSTVNATLQLSTVAEEIVVMGEATEQISDTNTASETVVREDLESLAVSRDLTSAIGLAAGVHATENNGTISISGAQTWENLFLLNGVTLNENLRGQPFTLYIEDAIQETTTATSGVSAEYGRFTGGVVNAITKSGGNQFSGSFRTSFDNQDWEAPTPLTTNQTDEVNETFEATFGGPILRDRIWFFLAGRNRDTATTSQTRIFNLPFDQAREQDRLEGKLTFSLTKSHQLQVSAQDIDDVNTNVGHGGLTQFNLVPDDGSLVDRATPQKLKVGNYTGILTPNFFVEAQYSEREFSFVGSGGLDQSLNTGTPVWDLNRGVIYNESLFCGSCRDEERDNQNTVVKGSYFLSTGSAGSHDLVFGYDTFDDIRAADNHQSPNDLMIWNFAGSIFDNPRVFPIFNDNTLIEWLPILNPTQGTSFVTNSAFINDRWRLNDKWSFNVGLRYDENDGANSLGDTVVSDSEISPRFGATYRPSLDSPWLFNLSLGRYVGAIANTIANSSSNAGVPAQFEYLYLGPTVNVGANAGNALSSPEALDILYNWFFGECPNVLADPFSCSQLLVGVDVPGVSTLIGSGLASTSGDEYTIGFQRELGTRGSLRVDYVRREWNNFYSSRIDLSTANRVDDQGNRFDLAVIENEDNLRERTYDGINVIARYNLMNSRLRLGGNYTWSHAIGTFNGETGGSGPVTSDISEYPEFKEARWNTPRGNLEVDQRHKIRAWAIYDIIRSQRQTLNVSLLQSFLSGDPYSAVGDVDSEPFVDPAVVSQYVTPPTTVDYFFSGRGAFTTDDITRTDLSLNYSINFGRFELYLQPEILNVFDEQGLDGVNNSVITVVQAGLLDEDPNSDTFNPTGLLPFNPFTETPVEGVHYRFDDDFGQPEGTADFQNSREFRFSVGFRF